MTEKVYKYLRGSSNFNESIGSRGSLPPLNSKPSNYSGSPNSNKMANAVGGSRAVDSLEQLFVKANNDLTAVQHKLEIESEQRYPGKANPYKLMYRIKKIQEELPSLKDQCEKLLAAKQDLIDKTQSMLVGNRALLQRMQARANIPVICDSNDTVYTSFEKIIDEWNEQLGLKSSEMGYDNGSVVLGDLNQKLFSSKIQSC